MNHFPGHSARLSQGASGPGLARRLALSFSAFLCSSLWLASCGGGTSTDIQSPMGTVSVGADFAALPAESIRLEASAQAGLTVAWSQVSGPLVELVPEGPHAVRFLTPILNGVVVLRATASLNGQVADTDDVAVTVRTVRGTESFSVLSRLGFPDTQFSEPASPASVTYSHESERAFVLDTGGRRVLVVGLNDPSNPTYLGALPEPTPQGAFSGGQPRAIAATASLLAVAYDGPVTEEPGRLVFFHPATLTEIASFGIDPQPSALKWAASVPQLALVCSGEPIPPDVSHGSPSDGSGSITLFRIPPAGPASLDPLVHATRIDFSAFDSERAALLADGVRLPRPTVSVSQDLEPRSIEMDPSGERAWIGLPANGAAAVLDFSNGTVESLRGLQRADWQTESLPASAEVTTRVGWNEGRPTSTVSFSGLDYEVPELDVAAFEMVSATANTYEFDFVMGRGPALVVLNPLEGNHSILGRPDFQHRIVRATVDLDDGSWTIGQEIPLRTGDSLPITARAGLQATSRGLAFQDEVVKGPDLTELALDPNGAILTGIARVGGEIWCSDARRPSLLRFDASGALIDRYVPEGSNQFGPLLGVETLPGRYALAPAPLNSVFRGGFQGLAALPSGELATILRSSLDNPDTAVNLSSINSRVIRLLLVDPATGQPSAEYAVAMDDTGSGVADLAIIDGHLHIVEESSCSGARRLVRLDLGSATNLLQLGVHAAQIQAELEGTDPLDLGTAFPIPVLPALKTLVADLSAAGLSDGSDFSLAQFGGELLFATSDASGFPQPSRPLGDFAPCASRLQYVARPSFGKLELRSRGIDPSGQDGGAGPRSFPIQGLRQIVDMVTYPFPGEGRVIHCIDGHLVRDLGVNIFEESARVSDLPLDTLAFPNASSLQLPGEAGPLRVSKLDGDADGDGLHESLLAFGGRSILTLDEHLNPVHDSGDTIDRQQRRYFPNVAQRLEASAPEAGSRPAAAFMTNTGQSMLVAFEDAGVVATFDLPGAAGLLWTGNLPTAPGARPVDVLEFFRVNAGSLRSYVLIADSANGTLDVIERE